MRIGTLALASTIVAASLLAACSGGSTSPNPIITPPSSAPAGGGPGPDPNGYNADSIGAVNAIGAPMQGDTNPNDLGATLVGPNQQSGLRRTLSYTVGKCTVIYTNPQTSVMFIAPDANNDANSTELTRYASSNCATNTQLVDYVRIWTTPQAQTNGEYSETVNTTIQKWQSTGGGTPTVTRTAQASYANAVKFDIYGQPQFTTGTTRTEMTTVYQGTTSGQKLSTTGDEFIFGGALMNNNIPPQQIGNYFCGDQTGFNNVGSSTLNETFGWSSQSDPTEGQRIVNYPNPGQVTFQSVRIGAAYTGPIGFMSITQNAPNSSCPISTPMFQAAVQGGFLKLPFSIPVSYTYTDGFLSSVSMTNAQLGNNGFTVSISSQRPGSNTLMSGTITDTQNNTVIGTFTIGINGFGTLTVVDGHAYNIEDWHVVQS